ncbi:uncharacterized protein LOC106664333 [Cimex lectularius]|uniref:Uncharacterized protein n=1 Tax=Cimex lectularius TaxID=79782 RepID=A0A8I6RK92_CIMLE|nr:uncharacterized protein LOC106664333 [Cimex lectularius]XP_014245480.1 uncharacterized protein LOC106664333 [Cimex lectularius]
MVRPGLLTVKESLEVARIAKKEERRTLRQSILNRQRNIQIIEEKLNPEQLKQKKIKEWKELKKKRLEEEKKNKKPPFRSYIVVRHTGLSPFRKPEPNLTKGAVKNKRSDQNSSQTKLQIPKNKTGFAPKLNLPQIPFPSVQERSKMPAKNIITFGGSTEEKQKANSKNLNSHRPNTRTAASGKLLLASDPNQRPTRTAASGKLFMANDKVFQRTKRTAANGKLLTSNDQTTARILPQRNAKIAKSITAPLKCLQLTEMPIDSSNNGKLSSDQKENACDSQGFQRGIRLRTKNK